MQACKQTDIHTRLARQSTSVGLLKLTLIIGIASFLGLLIDLLLITKQKTEEEGLICASCK